MAEWKKNPVIGVVAGIILLITLALVIKVLIGGGIKKEGGGEFEKTGITPAEQAATKGSR